MKKTIGFNLVFALCLLLLCTSTSYASGATIKNYFLNSNSTLNIEDLSSGIYSILKAFGVILAVCIMMTMAIQWFLATPGKKAMLKERFIYYFAGVIFLITGISFLNWYEGVAKDVAKTFSSSGGNSSYSTSSPSSSPIKTKPPEEYDTDGDGKLSLEEMHKEISHEELDNMAEDAIEDGIETLPEHEVATLIGRLEGIDEEYDPDLDISYLLNNYEKLSTTHPDLINLLEAKGASYNTAGAIQTSDSELSPAENDLRDWYRYTIDGRTINYTDSDWENEIVQKNHQWYYNNVYLKSKNNE